MAELSHLENLQPALLDRLADDAPGDQAERRGKRVISLARLRQLVRRDLAWLLSTGRMESLRDLSGWPEVRRSVLNFGLPELSGVAVANMSRDAIERMVTDAILAYEPRILPNTLKVHADVSSDRMSRRAIQFEITGQLWAQPMPTELFLKTEVDLETGEVAVREAAG